MIDATGAPKEQELSVVTDTVVDEDTLDEMVRRASTPNLASLFQRGKDAGLIKPTSNYGETA